MSATTSPGDVFRQALWHNNAGLVQLLGLCPLLAVSNTLINGLGLGLATLFVVVATNGLVSLFRRWIHTDLRLPCFVLLIAALVTAVELSFKAWFFDLHTSLGLFIPLIVSNCLILGRAEAFASKQPVVSSLIDGLGYGLGFAAVLITLGALRELFGYGTVLAGAEMLFGPQAADWQVTILASEQGLILATLPPGAFLGLAFLVALRNRARRNSAALDTNASDLT